MSFFLGIYEKLLSVVVDDSKYKYFILTIISFHLEQLKDYQTNKGDPDNLILVK
jgi:hypothetical protein